MKDFQVFLSLARSLLTFLTLRSFLIASSQVFLGCPLGKLQLALQVLNFNVRITNENICCGGLIYD